MEGLSKVIQGAVASVASLALAASVAYETGYFSIIGKKYQGIISAADYLSGAVEWLPWLSLLYAAGLLTAWVGLPATLRSARRLHGIRSLIAIVLVIFVIVALWIGATVPVYQILLYAPFAALPLVVAITFIQLRRHRGSASKMIALISSGLLVTLALFCAGIGRAHFDIEMIDNAYVIKSGDSSAGSQVLRTMQKGLLVWKPDEKRIDFVGWEKIDRVTHLIWKSQDAPWTEPLGCYVWEGLCRRPPPLNP
jgi:hypothetical protein